MKLTPGNFLTHIKNLVTGGGTLSDDGSTPVNDSGFLKKDEGVGLFDVARDLTDSSGGTASTTLASTAGAYTLIIPHTFASGTSAGEVITAYVLGHAFEILSWSFTADVPGVGASASRVFNMEIGTTDVGTVASTVTLTEASTSAKGEQTAGTTVTGAATGTAADTFSVEVAAGGTQFTAGSGFFTILVKNLDTSNAFATLAAQNEGVADETNAVVLKVPATIDIVGTYALHIPMDYDEATDIFHVRVLASQLTVSTDNDVQLDAQVYKKTAGAALGSDLNPTIPSTILSTTEQWLTFDLSGNSFVRDDVVYFRLITDGHNDTAGEEVLIHAIEVRYRSCLVSYDETDGATVDSGNPLR